MYSQTRRRLLIVTTLATVVVAGYLLWPVLLHKTAQAIRAARTVSLAGTPPDFTLADAGGHRLRLADYKGKVVLLNFWATWCGPCKEEIPWFIEFEKQYRAQGFTVLGVSLDEDGWKAINPYVAAEKINYPIVLGTEEVNELYGGIEAIPTTLVIGRDGKVAYLHAGLIGKDEYRKEIVRLLGTAVAGSHVNSD